MNHRLVSEIIVAETVRVSSGDTARAAFGRWTNAGGACRDGSDSIATWYLVAVAEAACIREMNRTIDPSIETVIGQRVDIDRRQPIAPFTLLRLSGWVEQIRERSACFFVQASDARGGCRLRGADHAGRGRPCRSRRAHDHRLDDAGIVCMPGRVALETEPDPTDAALATAFE